MRRTKLSGINVLLCLLVLLTSKQVTASNIVPSSNHSEQISFISSANEGSTNDILYVRAANSSGISFNKFDHFEVSGKSLKIINVARRIETLIDSTPTLVEADEATRIVIMANSISLGDEVELVGPASDILFISTNSSGDISCTNCQLKNFQRITFAVASPKQAITDSTQIINQLSTSSNGSIDINNMDASGALVLEVLADSVSLQNDITTNVQVAKDSLGGYTQDINGTYSMGTGSVNLLVGSFDWDYDQQKIEKAYPQDLARSLGGSIRSVSVKVTTSEQLTINSNIDTRTDLLSTVRYDGNTHIANESIVLQSLGDWVVVKGNITSNGATSVKSTNDLTIDSGAKITSPNIVLIARNSISNFASIESDQIKLAGKNILNRGSLKSFESTEVWAEGNIVNNFGGVIIGPEITLESEAGLVRNGSRYPYLANVSELSELNEPLDVDSEAVNPTDSVHIGTFYRSDVYVGAEGDRIQPEKTSAHIVAKNLRIKALAVENINPYWKKIDASGGVILNKTLMNQVTMSGQYGIWMDTSDYILNSSAIVRVNDVAGLLAIKTGVLTNERYRTLNLLEKVVTSSESTETSTEEYNETTTVQTTTDTSTDTISFTTKSHTLSPPGFLVSMGNFELEASVGFVNNTAYLEVFGSAQFKTDTINDIGLEQDGINKTETVITTTSMVCWGDLTCDTPAGGGDIWSAVYSGYYAVSDEEIAISNAEQEMDSLFFVHGDIFGNETAYDSKDYDPFTYYTDLAAQSAIEREFGHLGEDGDVTTSYVSLDMYNYVKYVTSLSFSHDPIDENSGDNLLIKWDKSTSAYAFDYQTADYSDTATESQTSDSLLLSLIEELEIIWETLAQFFSDLFAEFDWWA